MAPDGRALVPFAKMSHRNLARPLARAAVIGAMLRFVACARDQGPRANPDAGLPSAAAMPNPKVASASDKLKLHG